MSVLIGHASIDERGKASGGTSGDQTLKEVCTRNWYNKPWNKVIRAKDANVAEKIAVAMEQACANNNIGYDQAQRTTLYTKAKEKNWNLSKITEKCECDCSSLVAVCVNAAGISVSKDIYTGNQANALKATGSFTIYTADKYIKSDSNLKRGDILLKEGSHTAIVLLTDSKSETAVKTPTATPKVDAAQNLNKAYSKGVKLQTTANLNMRTGAGTDKSRITVLNRNTYVTWYGYYNIVNGVKWYLVVSGNYTGYVSSNYLTS